MPSSTMYEFSLQVTVGGGLGGGLGGGEGGGGAGGGGLGGGVGLPLTHCVFMLHTPIPVKMLGEVHEKPGFVVNALFAETAPPQPPLYVYQSSVVGNSEVL